MEAQKKFSPTISVQKTYSLYFAPSGVMTCDEVIDIPLACTVLRHTKIGNAYYMVTPCVEIVAPNDIPDLKIITNEGITVEPFTIPVQSAVTPFNNKICYIVLPFGTTGIKKVITDRKKLALEFGIMPPPYYYDHMLFGVMSVAMLGLSGNVSALSKDLNTLDGRVDALETKKTYYGYIRNNGAHTIDFSKPGSTFIIKPDTRFIVFFVTNASSGNVSFEITLTSVRDENIHTKSTIVLPSGKSTVKMDLQSLEMYVMSADNIAKNVYNISGIQDSYYSGIKFGYNHNQNLTGNVEVHEWA